MSLYTLSSLRLEPLKEDPFKSEKEIQTLFEKNLNLITGLELIKSEFKVCYRRIDTLAFDNELKSFVIIEYKLDSGYSMIDQGFAYLNLMLEHKARFILEYNEMHPKTLKREEFNWDSSKIIFVCAYFNDFQILASGFKDIEIQLWELKRFESGLITVNNIRSVLPLGKRKKKKFKPSYVWTIPKSLNF